MPSRDPLQRLRAFPAAPAPNDDPAAVGSNLPEELVRLQQNILAYHVAHHPDSTVFGNECAKRLKLVEAYVQPREASDLPSRAEKEKAAARRSPGTESLSKTKANELEARTVCEITVEEGMLNVHGTLAGACATLLIDISTFSALFALGSVVGLDPTGFSTSMNIVWHAPAVQGTILRLAATSLSLKPRTASARCEVHDGRTGTLLISATQIVSPIQGLSGAGTTAAVPTGTVSSSRRERGKL